MTSTMFGVHVMQYLQKLPYVITGCIFWHGFVAHKVKQVSPLRELHSNIWTTLELFEITLLSPLQLYFRVYYYRQWTICGAFQYFDYVRVLEKIEVLYFIDEVFEHALSLSLTGWLLMLRYFWMRAILLDFLIIRRDISLLPCSH